MEGLPSAKELRKLATACRKAGIKSLKIGSIEFTLSDELPPSNRKPRAGAVKAEPKTAAVPLSTDPDVILDPNKPSPEDMLYWSVQDDIGQPANPEQ